MAAGEITELRPDQLEQLRTLLSTNRLPVDDCEEQADIFCGIFEDGELIAAGGLEPAASYALLRSVAVRESDRGRGLAQRITEHLLRRAERERRTAVYLLTETAADYFARLGFQAIERSDVPQAIRRTRQFDSLCPASATCMRLTLPLERTAARDAG